MTAGRLLTPVRIDQDSRDLWPAELGRRLLPLRQHLPHSRAGKADVRVVGVRAGLCRSHGGAGAAIEAVLEEHRRDAQVVWPEFPENLLRIVRAVVAPDTGVVAANYEMGAAIVLPYDCVEDRFPRSGVTHCRRVDGKQHPVLRVIIRDEDLVALHP